MRNLRLNLIYLSFFVQYTWTYYLTKGTVETVTLSEKS